jgi:tight adherence protein B
MLISTAIFLFCLFLTYAVFVLATRKSDTRRARLEHRVAEALQESLADAGPQDSLFRESSLSRNPALDRFLASINYVRKLELTLSQADIQITVSKLLGFCVAAGTLATLTAATLLASPVGVIGIGLVAAATPILYVSWKRRKRLKKFLEQLPDTLDLMSRSLAVGHAFSESLNQVATEMPDPISTEFRITFDEQKLGLTTKLALERLAERVPLLDLRLCVTAILIQRETGGNLAELLEKVAQTIRERFKLMEDFRTMTTGARGSAWILCGLPFFIIFMLTVINPDYISVLLHDKRGHYVLFLAAGMQVVGMLLIRKILLIRI